MSNYAGLIVGLGNPGAEYARTRHNYGFMAAESLLQASFGTPVSLVRNNEYNLWETVLVPNTPRWLVTTPLTFMNLSGRVVKRLVREFRLAPDRVIVLHDDMDLALGRMKMKQGGSAAGHNGVQSVIDHLGTQNFLRLRLGIGRPEKSGAQWVLAPFTEDEMIDINRLLEAVCTGLTLFVRRGKAHSITYINGLRLPAET